MEKRGNKWIFHKLDDLWYSSSGTSFATDEECWKKTGGSTPEQWNTTTWICLICKFKSKSFLDYVPENVRTPKEDLALERNKNKYYNDKLKEYKLANNVLNKKLEVCQEELNKKDTEIENLLDRLRVMQNRRL